MDWLYATMPLAGVDVFWPGLVILGVGVGIIGGFFGMGGAWMVTPGLNILGFPMAFAIGTGVVQVAGTAVVATIRHAKFGNVDAKMGALVAVGGIPGIQIGAWAVMWLERMELVEISVRILYVLLLCLVAWMVFVDVRKVKKAGGSGDEGGLQWHKALRRVAIPPVVSFDRSGLRCSIWLPIAVGVVIGFMAGLLGIGGGLIALPALMYFVGCPTLIAVGTSLFAVMFSALFGAYTYISYGRAEFLAALIMLVGASIGAHIGATATNYVKGLGIKYAFAGAVVGCAVSVVLKQLADAFPERCSLLHTCSLALVLCLVLALCVYIIAAMALGMRREWRGGGRTNAL